LADERIVAIGLLTQRDLDRIGDTLRVVPAPRDDVFAELLAKLDGIDLDAQGSRVVMRAEKAN
jgi:hypothetical protein